MNRDLKLKANPPGDLVKSSSFLNSMARILVPITTYCRLRIGQDDHLDQFEAYNITCTRIRTREFQQHYSHSSCCSVPSPMYETGDET